MGEGFRARGGGRGRGSAAPGASAPQPNRTSTREVLPAQTCLKLKGWTNEWHRAGGDSECPL
jgi:hypothetical protein